MSARHGAFLTLRVGQCTQRHHSATPPSAWQPGRRLTHLLDLSERGLAMKATRTCAVDGCDRRVHARGYCNTHYAAHYQRKLDRTCTLDGCDRPWHKAGLCSMHDSRLRRTGSVGANIYTHGSLEWRFWRKVVPLSPDQCWEWRAVRNEHGYGKFQGTYAHRVSYALSVGPIPDGLWVLHRCDNPPCVNPAHLFLGTPTDNMQDMIRKGRAAWQRRPRRVSDALDLGETA